MPAPVLIAITEESLFSSHHCLGKIQNLAVPPKNRMVTALNRPATVLSDARQERASAEHRPSLLFFRFRHLVDHLVTLMMLSGLIWLDEQTWMRTSHKIPISMLSTSASRFGKKKFQR